MFNRCALNALAQENSTDKLKIKFPAKRCHINNYRLAVFSCTNTLMPYRAKKITFFYINQFGFLFRNEVDIDISAQKSGEIYADLAI